MWTVILNILGIVVGIAAVAVVFFGFPFSSRRHVNEDVNNPELRQARREFNEQVNRGRSRPF